MAERTIGALFPAIRPLAKLVELRLPAPAIRLGGGMDIHKPKPWHGVREFLKEYLIIVAGVLTALAAEAGVEWLHWARQVDEAQATLKVAFVREAHNVAERAALDACDARRLAMLSAILQQATESGRLPPLGAIGRPPNPAWTVGPWEALVASQVVVHLPREKMAAYLRVIGSTRYLSTVSDQETAQWTILGSMTGPGRRLSDVEAETLRTTLAQAAASNETMHRISSRLRGSLTATGLVGASDLAEADKAAAAAPPAICGPAVAAGV
jgi:hypothetical protein